MIYISHELRAIYIHMPKCGGCYIRKILCEYYGFQNIYKNYKKREDYVKFFNNSEQVTDKDDGVDSIRKFGVLRYYLDHPTLDRQRIDSFKNYYIFTFVRNPYEKIVSGFLYVKKFVCSKYHERKSKYLEWLKAKKEGVGSEFFIDNLDNETLELFNALNPLDYSEEDDDENSSNDENQYVDPEFKNVTYYENMGSNAKNQEKKNRGGYLEKIEDNPEYYTDFPTYVKNRTNICNVSFFHSFLTQKQHLLNYDNEINIHYIGTTENLDNDLLNILSHLGINNYKHLDYIYKNIKINESNDKKSTTEYYNEETFNIVNELMNDDFQLFQYKKYLSYDEFVNNFLKNKADISYKNKTSITNIYKDFKLLNSNNDKIEKIDNEITGFLENMFTGLEAMLRIDKDNSYFHDTKDYVLKLFKNKKEILDVYKKLPSVLEIETSMINNNNDMKKNKHKCEKCNFLSYNNYALYCHNINHFYSNKE